MANRRMFAKTVIETDKFMGMPISTQCLYFHLLLQGDDEGFVANPRQIMRQLGASEDDMKILIAKEYVIAFDSGVIVIREWFIHNQLRRDRFTPTVHKEKSMLNLSDDKIYRLLPSGVDSSGNQLATNGCQNANHRLPQYSRVEYRLDKYRIDEDREDGLATNLIDDILSLYHEICPSLPSAKVVTPQREKAMRELYALLGNDLEAIREYFQKCADTPFLCGKSKNGWKANLDFLLDPSKCANIIEGKYDDWRDTYGGNGADNGNSGKTDGETSSFSADLEAFERQQDLPGEL